VAACFGTVGHDVVAVEADEDKLAALRLGRVPFYEDGLEPLLHYAAAEGRLRFTDDIGDAVRASEVIFLCVGTPQDPSGRPDMSAASIAATAIGAALDDHRVIVTKSTVPIGSGRWLQNTLERAIRPEARASASIAVVSNPEF